ncbi:MAG: hypothetical protein ABFD69_01040 [Candidatus Sumerlaeia bacterium]
MDGQIHRCFLLVVPFGRAHHRALFRHCARWSFQNDVPHALFKSGGISQAIYGIHGNANLPTGEFTFPPIRRPAAALFSFRLNSAADFSTRPILRSRTDLASSSISSRSGRFAASEVIKDDTQRGKVDQPYPLDASTAGQA